MLGYSLNDIVISSCLGLDSCLIHYMIIIALLSYDVKKMKPDNLEENRGWHFYKSRNAKTSFLSLMHYLEVIRSKDRMLNYKKIDSFMSKLGNTICKCMTKA